MTFVPSTAASTAVSSAVLAQHAALQRAEEEDLTPYTEEELLADFEFKIVRSVVGLFGKPDRMREVLEEEARFGWTLVEKFDDNRIRLKRPVDAKANDADALRAGLDPYRTNLAVHANKTALLVLGLVLMLGVAAIVLAAVLDG